MIIYKTIHMNYLNKLHMSLKSYVTKISHNLSFQLPHNKSEEDSFKLD